MLPHGCSIRSIHIEMRPARASSAAGRCHASARPAVCQLGQRGWQGLAAVGEVRGRESAPPAAQAPQPSDPGLHRERPGRRDRDARVQRGARIDAAAPRRCAPAALLSICRCSHLPVNKSILQFNAAASRPPGTDAAAEAPPPSPSPEGQGRDRFPLGRRRPGGPALFSPEPLQGTACSGLSPRDTVGSP